MTDLHCHILPMLDDGARDIASSIELLLQEKEQGVNRIIFTPHFDCRNTSLEDFLEKRQSSFEMLMENLPEELKNHFEFKLGAEVYFDIALRGVDVEKLCIDGTRYILLELPFSKKPQFINETLFNISNNGIIPIIAHVERYEYILKDPTLVYDWTKLGYCVQANAGAIKNGDSRLDRLLRWDLVHIVASDAHSVHRRPVEIKAAFAALDLDTASRLSLNADCVFMNKEIFISPHCPKKTFFGWK